MDRAFFKDLVRQQGERILDQFYETHKGNLDDCSNIRLFREFRTIMLSEIHICEDNIERFEEKCEKIKAGFGNL